MKENILGKALEKAKLPGDVIKELKHNIPGYVLSSHDNIGKALEKAKLPGDIVSDLFENKLKFYMNLKGITGKSIAEKLGVTEGAVINWSNGHRQPKNITQLTGLANILGVTVAELFPKTLEQREKITNQELKYNMDKYFDKLPKELLPSNIIKIKLLDGYIGAGSVGMFETEQQIDEIYVDINTIAKKYRNSDIKGIQIIGDSMKPYVDSGDIVLYTLLEPGFSKMDGKYIIRKNDSLMLKNIQFKINGDILITSENKAYSDEIIDKESQELETFSVIGAVVGRILKG